MRLALTGDGPRLAAVGVPEWIGADGTRIGWTIRDRLFLLDRDGVTVVELPEYAEDASAVPGAWTLALGNGFVEVDPASAEVVRALVDDDAQPLSTRPGRDVGVFVEAPEHRLLRLSDGLALPLPDGALRSRWLRPWATGIGAVWVDSEVLYRFGAESRIAAIGRAPGTAAIAAGPGGGVIVSLKADTVVAAPRALAVRVGRRLDAASARFAPDGLTVLAASEDGVAHVDLADGKVLKTWTGSFAPVGFASLTDIAHPVLWNVERGTLEDGDGRVILDGLARSAPSFAGARLAGPGGALWDLAEGTRVRTDLAGGACATDGARTVHVTDAGFRVLDGPTFPHGLVTSDEDEVEAARIDGDDVVITTLDGETGAWSLTDGAQRWRRAEPRRRTPPRLQPDGVRLGEIDGESWIDADGARYPLPADGAARVGGTIWLWTDEGALFALPRSSS